MQERRKAHEETLNRLNRRLRTLYQCNSTFFQAESEQELLQSICEILAAGGELRLAWIGYCEDDADKTIRPVAQAGHSLDYVERVKISWGDEMEAGHCPAGVAVRTGKACWVDDISTDPRFSAWRVPALARSYASCIALPLIAHGNARGAVDLRGTLNLYSAERNAFGESTIEYYACLATSITYAVMALRSRLAEDLTYGVTTVRASDQRRRAQEELRRSEQQWRDVFENNPTMYFMVDAEGTVMAVNPFGAEQLGYTVNELVGHPVLSVSFGLDREAVQRNVTLCLQQLGQSMSWELRKVRKDGSMLWVRETARGVLRGNDRVVLIACEDITERRHAEEKIRQQELELRQLIDLAPQHVAVLGPEKTSLHNRAALDLNQAALDYHGVTLEEWRSSGPGRFFHPDDWERMMSENEAAVLSGSPHETEARLLRGDGQYRWFLFRSKPLRDEQGRVTRWFVVATDIEDRKQAEQRLQNENVALREEIDKASMFEEIVGASPALLAVLSRASKVAPTDSTVLIAGETGTGKELIARAIHKRSQRSPRAFVSVNCAAIAPSLITSELFGHEKGAFTGAVQRRLGRFELAEGGTIFLDEIGELPPETQITLLRVLQEREFERVGGNQSIRVDVRVIAATNRALQAAIAAGTFRSDLYYRLNVFPIEMPPLRERKEDIPLLVEYFIHRYGSRVGKRIRGVERRTLELFEQYPWPGNIRELQNIIERSVIVCETENFSVDESWLSRVSVPTQPASQPLSAKLATEEREMIEAALGVTKGRVAGPSGAAERLGMPASTLESKIRSLKINKHRFKSG